MNWERRQLRVTVATGEIWPPCCKPARVLISDLSSYSVHNYNTQAVSATAHWLLKKKKKKSQQSSKLIISISSIQLEIVDFLRGAWSMHPGVHAFRGFVFCYMLL